ALPGAGTTRLPGKGRLLSEAPAWGRPGTLLRQGRLLPQATAVRAALPGAARVHLRAMSGRQAIAAVCLGPSGATVVPAHPPSPGSPPAGACRPYPSATGNG